MQIRGCKKPKCALCSNAFINAENSCITCMISGEDKQAQESCKKFEYDIFKYEPEKKIKEFKFSKEDFQI